MSQMKILERLRELKAHNDITYLTSSADDKACYSKITGSTNNKKNPNSERSRACSLG